MSQPFAILLAEQAVREFTKQWYAGLQPCLLLETHADGAIFVSSRVTGGVTHPQQAENVFPSTQASQHHHHQHRRPPGPSRLRRRERRAQARELAAAQAATVTQNKSEEAAVQAVASPPAGSQAAVQAVAPSPARADVAVQAAILPPHLPAVQADPPLGQPDGSLQVLLSQLQGDQQYLMDTFCSDRDYFGLERKQTTEEERKKERQADIDKIKRMMENI